MKTVATLPGSPREKGSIQRVATKSMSKVILQPKQALENAGLKSDKTLVFLVDDDRLFLKSLEHAIKDKQPLVDLRTFQTGEACLQQMKLKPEVVVLDYYLNSSVPYAWNGFTILKQIKKISPKTKVIMLSAQDSLDVAVKCIDNGAFDYISKSETAYIKINNMLSNVIEDIKINKEGMKPYQIVIVLIVIVLTACFLYFK